jgi:hypothetical protein
MEESLAVQKQEEAEHAREEAKKDLLGAGIRLWIVLGTIGFQFSACNSLRLGMSIPKNLSRKTRNEQEKSSALTNPNPL